MELLMATKNAQLSRTPSEVDRNLVRFPTVQQFAISYLSIRIPRARPDLGRRMLVLIGVAFALGVVVFLYWIYPQHD